MRHSVTTPGGFFIGLGGIAASLFVAYAVYSVVRKPTPSNELQPQQIALNLVAKADANDQEKSQIRKATDELLKKAAAKYNNDQLPDLDKLDDLRGVVRYRESQKSLAAAHEALAAPSKELGADQKPLTVLAAAKKLVVTEIGIKKVAASTVKVDLNPPAEKLMPPPLPNLGSGGVNNVVFPEIKPAAPEAPKPTTSAPVTPAPTVAVVNQPAAPNRPPLLNGTESTK